MNINEQPTQGGLMAADGMEQAAQPDAPASPEAIEAIEIGAVDYLHGQGREATLQALQGEGEPSQKIAMATFGIMKSFEQQHPDTPGEILLAGATKVVDAVFEFAQAAGLDVTEDDRQGGFYLAYGMWQEAKPPEERMGPEQFQDVDPESLVPYAEAQV